VLSAPLFRLYRRVVHKYTDFNENLNEKWFHQSGTEMFLVQSEIHRERGDIGFIAAVISPRSAYAQEKLTL